MPSPKPVTRHETIKYLSKPDIERLLQSVKPHSIRDYTILLIAYNHGLRATEVGLLKLSDYKQLEKRLYITRVKGGISNSYLVSDEGSKALKLWIAIRGNQPGPLFVSRRTVINENTEMGIGRKQLDNIFKDYTRRLSNPPIAKDKQHFHVLRHSIAVEMVDRGVPLVQIKDWLGHRNINSTIVYANVSDKTRDETARMIFQDNTRENDKNSKVNWKKDKKK